MSGDHGLIDLRFEGYSNHDLANQIDGLRNKPGNLYDVVTALNDIANALDETDMILREQLRKIGVEWQGQAAESGTEATQNASIYAEHAATSASATSGGLQSQGEAYAHITNSAPESGSLRGPTELNGVDRFAGVFGYTTDHARDVQATSTARDQAVAGMTNYQAGSQQALDQYRPLPVPPGMNLVAAPVEGTTQTSSVGSFGGSGGAGPGGTGGGPGSAGGGAGGPFGGAAPFGGIGPDAPGNPGSPGGRGNFSGVGPFVPPGTGLPGSPGGPQGGVPRVPPLFAAEAAVLAGSGAAGAAAGAGAEKDRLVRGRGGPGGVGGGPDRAGGRGGSVPVASVPDDEAKAARNAEKFGARSGRPGGGSIMQPAATAGGARKVEDKDHVRKYGIDSGDVFDDDRLTAPASIGDDQDDSRAT